MTVEVVSTISWISGLVLFICATTVCSLAIHVSTIITQSSKALSTLVVLVYCSQQAHSSGNRTYNVASRQCVSLMIARHSANSVVII